MNPVLMEHIARHVLVNFGVVPSSFIDYTHSSSLSSKEFVLEQKLLFKNESGDVVKNDIYGCQVSVEQKEFKILLGDCSQDPSVPEFCLTVQFTDNPTYGLYLVCDPSVDSEALIAVTVNDKDWMPCSTFLQATFLAAMEQLKDIGLGWSKCTNYQKSYETLLTMINFHTAYSEVEDEGQESVS
jgi:hypothetical protein